MALSPLPRSTTATSTMATVTVVAAAIRIERPRRRAAKFGIGPLVLAAPDNVVTEGEVMSGCPPVAALTAAGVRSEAIARTAC